MNKKIQLLQARLPDLSRFKSVSLKLIMSIATLLVYIMKLEEGFDLVVMNFNHNRKWSIPGFETTRGEMKSRNIVNKGVVK